MDITSISIKIFDTHDNDLELVEEFAQRGGINFQYHGGDDRFSKIVGSELSFSMMVDDMSDAKFLHLFTGSETRYRVEMQDTSVVESPVILWRGFLMPNQFEEPWTNTVFFVKFTATDGLGRIKQTKLPASFYNVKTGISVVLADCLKQTGLVLPIYIAPAIVNAVVNLKYSQIAVNTAAYDDGKKQLNPYQIIDNILVSIGCKLFQWKEVWYVVGINRFADSTIVFEEYDADGVYVQQTTVNRLENTVVFEENPIVSVQSPFKRVIVEWDKNLSDSIFPKDISYQPPVYIADWSAEGPIKYWEKSSADFVTGLTSYDFVTLLKFGVGTYFYNPQTNPLPVENPFYISVYQSTVSDDLDANYISLEDPIYLEGSLGADKYVSLTLEFRLMSFTELRTVFDAGGLDDSFQFDLTLDGVTIVSNKPAFTDSDGFQIQLSMAEHDYRVDAILKVEKVPINANGYLDLKLSAPVGSLGAAARVVYKKIDITYNTEDETLTKVRDVDFTTEKTIDVYHADDKMSISNRRFLFTDDVVVSVDVSDAGFTNEIEVLSSETRVGIIGTTIVLYSHYWYISEADFNKINTAEDNDVYFYVGATGVYYNAAEWSQQLFFDSWAAWTTDLGDGRFAFYEITDSATPDPVRLIEGNSFSVMRKSTSETITNLDYLTERWRRYEHSEDIRFTEALARVYHDTAGMAAFKINGTAEGFINPLEMILFTFINGKKFVIGNSAISIDLSTTTLELIEATKSNVEDYVTE
tara:strand:- start:397 stop:2655 length:2259 start_codon:yes stop_codon:yes gene_type:complete